MADKELRIRVKLLLDDDNAKKKLTDLQRGLRDQTRGWTDVRRAAGELDRSLNQAAIAAVAVAYGVMKVAKGFIEVASNAEDANKALAGIVMSVEGIPLDKATMRAKQFRSELFGIAGESGKGIKDVSSAFSVIEAASGLANENVSSTTDKIKDLSKISNILGMDVKSAAEKFTMLESGLSAVRGMQDPFTRLMAQQMEKFSGKRGTDFRSWLKDADPDTKAHNFAVALKKVAASMGEANPTFTELSNNIKTLGTNWVEHFMGPIMATIEPAMMAFTKQLKLSQGGLQALGTELGYGIAEVVNDAVPRLMHGFAYLKSHTVEIRMAFAEIVKDVTDGFKFIKRIVEFVVEHKSLLLGLYAANKTGVTSLVASQGLPLLGKGIGMAASAAGGPAAIAAAVAAAIIGYAGNRIYKMTSGDESPEAQDAQARIEAAKRYIDQKDTARASEMLRLAKEGYPAAEAWAEALQKVIDGMNEATKAGRQMAESVTTQSSTYRAAERTVEAFNEVVKNQDPTGLKTLLDSIAEREKAMGDRASGDPFAIGGGSGDKADTLPFSTLIQSIANDMTLQGQGLDDVFGKMTDNLTDRESEVLDALRAAFAAQKKRLETVKPGDINFHNAKFEIHQDFRDADPDRIVAVFRKDLAKASISRVQGVGVHGIGGGHL